MIHLCFFGHSPDYYQPESEFVPFVIGLITLIIICATCLVIRKMANHLLARGSSGAESLAKIHSKAREYILSALNLDEESKVKTDEGE